MASDGALLNNGIRPLGAALTKTLANLECRLALQAQLAESLAAESSEARSALLVLLDCSETRAKGSRHLGGFEPFIRERDTADAAAVMPADAHVVLDVWDDARSATGFTEGAGISSSNEVSKIIPAATSQPPGLKQHRCAWPDANVDAITGPTPKVKRKLATIYDEDHCAKKASLQFTRRSGFNFGDVFQPAVAAMHLQRGVTASNGIASNGRVFADADDQKDRLLESITEDTPGEFEHYHDVGLCQTVVKSSVFECISFFMVCASSVWIAVEIEAEDGDRVPMAFEFVAHFFCLFFLLEVSVQFIAFKDKRRALVDKAFLFDTALVILIVLETWVLKVLRSVTALEEGGSDLQGVVVFRILRVLKVLRLGHVLRQLPELLVIIRGIAMAMKAISIIVVLLALIIYVAAICFKVVLEGTDLGARRFRSVPMAMGTLLIEATLSGNKGGQVLTEAHNESIWIASLLLVYVLMANVTVMGILGGILVRTVATVADVEKAESDLTRISNTLSELWDLFYPQVDTDGDGRMSVHEFRTFVTCPNIVQVLRSNDIDLRSFIVSSEFLFQDHGGVMTKPEFKRCVLDHRGKMTAKVKDHVDTRLYLHSLLQRVSPDRRQSQAVINSVCTAEGIF